MLRNIPRTSIYFFFPLEGWKTSVCSQELGLRLSDSQASRTTHSLTKRKKENSIRTILLGTSATPNKWGYDSGAVPRLFLPLTQVPVLLKHMTSGACGTSAGCCHPQTSWSLPLMDWRLVHLDHCPPLSCSCYLRHYLISSSPWLSLPVHLMASYHEVGQGMLLQASAFTSSSPVFPAH